MLYKKTAGRIILFVIFFCSLSIGVRAGQDQFIPVLVSSSDDVAGLTRSATILGRLVGLVENKEPSSSTIKFLAADFQETCRLRGGTVLAGGANKLRITPDEAKKRLPYAYAALEEFFNQETPIFVTPYFENCLQKWCHKKDPAMKPESMSAEIKTTMKKIYNHDLIPLMLRILNEGQLLNVADTLYDSREKKEVWFDFGDMPEESINCLINYMSFMKAISGDFLLSTMKLLASSENLSNLFKISPQFFLLTVIARDYDEQSVDMLLSCEKGESENSDGENIETDQNFTWQLLRINDSSPNISHLIPKGHDSLVKIIQHVKKRQDDYVYLHDHLADSLANAIDLSEKQRGGNDYCSRERCVGLLINALLTQRIFLLSMIEAKIDIDVQREKKVNEALKEFLKTPMKDADHDKITYQALAALIEFPTLIVPITRLYQSIIDKKQSVENYTKAADVIVRYLSEICPYIPDLVSNDTPLPESKTILTLGSYCDLSILKTYIDFKINPPVSHVGDVTNHILEETVKKRLRSWDVDELDIITVTFMIDQRLQAMKASTSTSTSTSTAGASKESGAAISETQIQDISEVLTAAGIGDNPEMYAQLILLSQKDWSDCLGGDLPKAEKRRRKSKLTPKP